MQVIWILLFTSGKQSGTSRLFSERKSSFEHTLAPYVFFYISSLLIIILCSGVYNKLPILHSIEYNIII